MKAELKALKVEPSWIESVLDSVHARHVDNLDGGLADYIPELASADPDRFGLAIATKGGKLYVAGDAEHPFTIQSISKAFIYCLALELVGRDEVLKRVGVEPSGDAFNAILFDPHTHRPFNPMVNAGAITVTGIVRDVAGAGAFDLILERLSEAAGRSLSVDEAVCTARRPRPAIATAPSGTSCAMSARSTARSRKPSISISANARFSSARPTSRGWARRSPISARTPPPGGKSST